MPRYEYVIRRAWKEPITGRVSAETIQEAADKVARRYPQHREFHIEGAAPRAGQPEDPRRRPGRP